MSNTRSRDPEQMRIYADRWKFYNRNLWDEVLAKSPLLSLATQKRLEFDESPPKAIQTADGLYPFVELAGYLTFDSDTVENPNLKFLESVRNQHLNKFVENFETKLIGDVYSEATDLKTDRQRFERAAIFTHQREYDEMRSLSSELAPIISTPKAVGVLGSFRGKPVYLIHAEKCFVADTSTICIYNPSLKVDAGYDAVTDYYDLKLVFTGWIGIGSGARLLI